MVSTELSEGISETLDILNHMEKKYINKIPERFKIFLEKNKSDNYISNLDHSKKLSEMNLKEKTKDILAIIYIKYWCTSEEKNTYVNILNENQIKKEEELRQKYNPDNLFKKKVIENIEINDSEQVGMIKYKENRLKKIINKIKCLFHFK